MIFISADKINLRAPYRVKQVDDSVFAFTTKHGISYTASFVADVSFFDEGVYQFFLTKTSGKKGRKDDDISETVKVIIEEFFAHEEAVMLYICDTADGRQASRDRLFRAWFYSFEESESFTLHTEGMMIDNVRYLSSILLRNDHPLYLQVLGAFHNFTIEHNEG